MDDATFWSSIALIDVRLLDGGDDEAAVAPLVDALSALPTETLEGFDELLATKLHALDGRRYADAAGASGGSDDGFLYARCFVVAKGRAHYDAVLADPSRMPKTLEQWCEPLLSVAAEAYESATGEEWSFTASVSYETGSNEDGWA